LHLQQKIDLASSENEFYGVVVIGGYGSMVEPQPSKLMVRVRFPLPAPDPTDSDS
tara:strand:- start:3271 stop:3435 length:165 start_codon:yes stop_codon:yes gene_type:complete